MWDRGARERAHGLTALILGLFLLGVGSNLGISKTAVDLLGGMLSIPEYPAAVLRDAWLRWRVWGEERSALQGELRRLREENARLRAAGFGAGAGAGMDRASLASARVTLRAPMSWWDEVRVDRGTQDGIAPGTPVFHEGYLAGRVSSASLLSSWVELLTSPSLLIPVVVEETRDLGVLMGDGEGGVVLRYIPSGRGVEPDMRLSTALVGEQLPPGLPIGKVGEELERVGGYSSFRVEPGAALSRLDQVSLLRPEEEP